MFVEIHVIQNFAPANLNRDDTGSPKDCEFGGHRRARVSSQCWKRSIREYFSQEALVTESELGVRTRKLVGHLAGVLQQWDATRTEENAAAVVTAALVAFNVGVEVKESGEVKTNVLLFLGNDQIDRLAKICHEHWDELHSWWEKNESTKKNGSAKKKESTKKNAKLSKAMESILQKALQGSSAVDLALFGRMIAEDPAQNVDAACQVAHALSTHRVAPEFDYYTAVDDLGRDDETGAGMIGTQEFNSACFYRYANVSVKQLTANLQSDRQRAQAGLRTFLKSFIMAIPKAKQNSTAAQSRPSFVMVVVRDKGLASMANAFGKPVDGQGKGLMVNSVDALTSYWDKHARMYGMAGVREAHFVTLEDADVARLHSNGVQPAASVDALLEHVMAAVEAGVK